MNFDVSYCNSCGGKMIKVAFKFYKVVCYVVKVWWKTEQVLFCLLQIAF